MPAWPTNVRDDEIWPLVTFLEEFAGMSSERYQQLVSPELSEDTPPQILNACAAYHGA